MRPFTRQSLAGVHARIDELVADRLWRQDALYCRGVLLVGERWGGPVPVEGRFPLPPGVTVSVRRPRP